MPLENHHYLNIHLSHHFLDKVQGNESLYLYLIHRYKDRRVQRFVSFLVVADQKWFLFPKNNKEHKKNHSKNSKNKVYVFYKLNYLYRLGLRKIRNLLKIMVLYPTNLHVYWFDLLYCCFHHKLFV